MPFLYKFASDDICIDFVNQQIYYLSNIYFFVACVDSQNPLRHDI